MNIREIERERSYLHKTAWVYPGQQELWTEFGSQFCHEPHLNYTLDKPLNQLFNKLFIIDQSYFWSFLNQEKFISYSKIIFNWNKIGSKFIFIWVLFQTVAFSCGRWIRTVLSYHCPWSSPCRPFTEQLVLSSPTTNYTVFSESYRWKGSVTHN